MKARNRVFTIIIALVTAFALGTCSLAESDEAMGLKDLRLGTSEYVITVPESFETGALTEEDVLEGQVGYYYSGETPLDFDVYQFDKDVEGITLAEYAAEEAALYDSVTELTQENDINGIPVAWYRTTEEYEGEAYETITFILEEGDQFAEIVFWLDGDQAEAEMETIIESLRVVPMEGFEDEAEAADAVVEAEAEAESEYADEEDADVDIEDDADVAEDVDVTEDADVEEDVDVEEDAEIAEDVDVEEDVGVEEGVDVGDEDDYPELPVNVNAVSGFNALPPDAEPEEAATDGDDEIEDALKDILAEIVKEIIDSSDEESTPEEYVEAAMENIGDELMTDIRDALGTVELQLGTSPFSITIPGGYQEGELSEQDIADDLVAYYLGDEDHVDFDVYQFSKEGLSEDLAHYVMDEASEYEGTIQVVANDMINDIPVAWYRTLEDYEGVTYTTDTYIMDTGDEYVEVVFWFESDADIVRSHDIINTLREE